MKKVVILFFFLDLFVKVNASEFKLTEVINNLARPWSLTFVDETNVLITEKHGSIIQLNLGPVNIHANQMMVHTKLSIDMKLRSSFS